MGFIRVAKDGFGFEDATNGQPFVPIGSNYCATMGGTGFGGNITGAFPLFGRDDWSDKDGVKEGVNALGKLAELGVNVIRIWLEPDVFFPHGRRLDTRGSDNLEALIEAGRRNGILLSIGMHLTPTAGGGRLHNFEPPHQERQLEMLYLMGRRWAEREQIFSWTIVGEGTLPWQTSHMAEKWPAFLQYWYNDDIELLKRSWGSWLGIRHFKDAPIPPMNIGKALGFDRVNPGRLKELPEDPWAGSNWRYDWRMFLEDIGSQRVHLECRTLRQAGVKQMITVGNNSFTFPNLPANQMALGYNPYFYIDSVDYVCLHNYPAPQCLAGGNGDPLDSGKNMRHWLTANQIMGRISGSLGKPLVMEEFGWYGGGECSFLNKLPHRSEEDHARYMDRMMESMEGTYSGWFHWLWRDMPLAGDVSKLGGLYAADGKRVKAWGRHFARWAQKLKAKPCKRTAPTRVVPIVMKDLYTSDVAHETWWQNEIAACMKDGPRDYEQIFEPRPMTITHTDLRKKHRPRKT